MFLDCIRSITFFPGISLASQFASEAKFQTKCRARLPLFFCLLRCLALVLLSKGSSWYLRQLHYKTLWPIQEHPGPGPGERSHIALFKSCYTNTPTSERRINCASIAPTCHLHKQLHQTKPKAAESHEKTVAKFFQMVMERERERKSKALVAVLQRKWWKHALLWLCLPQSVPLFQQQTAAHEPDIWSLHVSEKPSRDFPKMNDMWLVYNISLEENAEWNLWSRLLSLQAAVMNQAPRLFSKSFCLHALAQVSRYIKVISAKEWTNGVLKIR